MMGPLPGNHGFHQFWLHGVGGQIKDMHQAGVRGSDIHGLAAIDEIHLQGHAAIDL